MIKLSNVVEKYKPNGATIFKRAVDRAAYQDATLQMAEIAKRGDAEMRSVILSRVKALTGRQPSSIKTAIKIMLEHF